jgi:hypothetical protein
MNHKEIVQLLNITDPELIRYLSELDEKMIQINKIFDLCRLVDELDSIEESNPYKIIISDNTNYSE